MADSIELGEEIAALATQVNRATHGLLTRIRRFDEVEGWAEQGAKSCAHWLTWRIGLDPGTACEKVRVARALGTLTKLDAAFTTGNLSYAKVRAVTRKLEIVVTADEANLVVQAVERAREAIACKHTSGEASPRPRAADGLMELVASYLAGQTATDTAIAPKAEVVVHLERDLTSETPGLIATLDDGTPVSAETLRRLACDGGLVPASIDEEHAVLDVGRRTRAIPSAIRRALLLRDHGCRFPGCPSTRFLHGHHVQHWLHGGRTALSNLVLLCSFHHRLVHEGGFTISLTEPVPEWDGDAVDYDAAVGALWAPLHSIEHP